jgi:glycosyltransferase involved in cell wall biosynthesis
MSLKPKVNVLLANYNYGRYIQDAINSALYQTYPCFLTIIDDHSTDESWDIIKENFTNPQEQEVSGCKIIQSSSILAVRMPHSVGPSGARNVGIVNTVSFSDYYQVLDADDYMYDDKVEKLMEKAMSDSRIGVVYADYDIFNVETGNLMREFKEPFSLEKLARECIVHSGALVSKNALMTVKDQYGIYDEEMRTAEDYDLWLRIAKKFLICHVPEPLTFVRNHRNNSSHTVDKEVWNRNWQRIQQKHRIR